MQVKNALIGYSGFIGSNLLKFKNKFHKYNSKNINKIKNKKYNLVICAGTSSKIWLAKKKPSLDLNKIKYLINNLKKVKAKKFVLISTCEVYGLSKNQKENSLTFSNKNYHYGNNRLMLENFVKKNFKKSYILRLPIVYGKNFNKNCIFDLIYNNNIEKLNGSDKIQIYNVNNLKKHINLVLKNNISVLNISSKPIQLNWIAEHFFNIKLNKKKIYRNMKMQTIHGKSNNDYFLSQKKCIDDLREFIKKTK
tara:strand:+ start:741 stop:1493 length:753 start_codon:yes stop_codon:yes gene_type:complete